MQLKISYMPRKPFFYSHGKLILVFIHLLNNGNSLNNRFVLSIHIKLNIVSGKGMG